MIWYLFTAIVFPPPTVHTNNSEDYPEDGFVYEPKHVARHTTNTPNNLWLYNFITLNYTNCRSQWPRGLRRRSAAARLLRLWVRIPPRAWMFVCCECCVLSGRGLRDGLITRPEQSYRLWRVVVCDLENSRIRRLKPATGLWKYNHNGL